MTFARHVTYAISTDGVIERGSNDLPPAVRLPFISLTLAPEASSQKVARLLRRLADEIEGQL